LTEQFLTIFLSIASFKTIFWVAVGVLLGIIVGAIPGLTATMAVALLLSITFGMDTADALAVLISVYLGGIYGGSRSAILLNVPGTPSSAATAIDGFPLAQRGEGALASIVATVNSAVGGWIGVVILFVAAPIIARVALKIAVWEYFWLAIFGIAISANLTGKSLVKGLIAGMLGLLITTVGLDPVYGDVRLTFGSRQLLGGVSLIPAMIGLFGLTEALDAITSGNATMAVADEIKEDSLFNLMKKSLGILKKHFDLTIISSLIGTFIGALPGVGPDIASWVSYDTAKRRSKNKEKFGNGSYEGLLASETGNNAATSGVFIPLLTLGIPGCAVSAVILGGMRLHGLRPGPTFFIEQKEFIAYIIGILILANFFIIIMGILTTKFLNLVVKVPSGIVMPIVIVFSTIGAYAISYRTFDIAIMFFFGVFGLCMRKLKIPAPPMVLGIILGNMAEINFRKALIVNTSFLPFFTRPISFSIVFIMIAILFGPWIMQKFQKSKAHKTDN